MQQDIITPKPNPEKVVTHDTSRSFVTQAAKTPKKRRQFGLRIVLVGLLVIALSSTTYLIRLHKPTTRKPASTNNAQASSELPATIPIDHNTSSSVKLTPWKLQIPSLKLDAVVQEVGLTSTGNMAVPNNFTDVGWYKAGPAPGTPGTSVLAGHLNGGRDKTAVFADLDKLKIGDYIEITEPQKPIKRFKVTGTEEYDVKGAPLEKIFGSTSGSHLNLITCSGSWDQKSKDYNKRRVVFTELAS